MFVLLHYSLESYPICVKCGEKETGFLEIDHIKGVIEDDGRGGPALVKYIINNNFPENYQVLKFFHIIQKDYLNAIVVELTL